MPGRARREQHRGGRRGLTDADRLHVGLDVLHRVVDREQTGDLAARRVDVHHDVLVGIFRLEDQQLGDDQVGDRVVDRRAHEDDAVVREPRVRIPFHAAARRVLDESRHRARIGCASARSRLRPFVWWTRPRSDSSCTRLVLRRVCVVWAGGPSGIVRSITFPSSSTTVAWSTRNSSAFPRARSERTVSSAPLRSRSRRTFSTFSSSSIGEPLDLGVDLVVGDRDSLLRDDCAQRQVGEHGLAAALRARRR